MSGGHLDYRQYQIDDIADDIGALIRENDLEDCFGHVWDYPPEILKKFEEAEHTLRQASEMVHRIDWLVSGDDGNETFLKRWKEEVRDYYNTPKQHLMNITDED